MTSFTSYNSECFCMEDGGCELMTCGHAIHVKCSIKLDKCPWCQQAHIKYIKTDIQRQYEAKKQQQNKIIHEVSGMIDWNELSYNPFITANMYRPWDWERLSQNQDV
jgi:hypothetical protein